MRKRTSWISSRIERPVSIPINTSAEPELAADHSWTNKVAHWLDASDASTVIKYARSGKPDTLRYEFQGLYPVVCGWTDRVKGTSDKFLFSRDAFNGCFPYYLPYIVEGGLNGKDYLSFGESCLAVNNGGVDRVYAFEARSFKCVNPVFNA